MSIAPYPGLRPFKPEEDALFFGQEDNLDDLFQRLARNHFIAVLGESGCGKSSLVRAGLIPMLIPTREGAVISWRVAITQPGRNPIRNLADSLAGTLKTETGTQHFIETTLRESPLGLLTVVEQARWSARRFLLIVVDQFEELFRFRKEEQRRNYDDEAALYVQLLLNAARGKDAEIYILLTMRSEYLGDASIFYNLAEAISDGLFLLPRMKRMQCEDAIVQPALAMGAEIKQSVVQRLLNETEEREDGLPLLQHGLRRLWDTADNGDRPRHLALPRDFCDGTATDYVQWSLNDHLARIMGGLAPSQRQLAAKLFKLLGDVDLKGRLIRRPTEWRELKAISTDQEAILAVIDTFRDEGRGQTFLVPSRKQQETFADEDKIDISHEVLLRKWDTYRQWLREEAEDSAQYIRLADAADRWAKKDGELLQGIELHSLVGWRNRFQPTSAWAARYIGNLDERLQRNSRDYAAAIAFLEDSVKETNAKAEQQRVYEEQQRSRVIAAKVEAERKKWQLGLCVGIAVICLGLAGWLIQRRNAKTLLKTKDMTIDNVTRYDDQIAMAKQEGLTMDERVPAAIKAASLARAVSSVPLEQRLSQQISLDQWELFSAVRKGGILNAPLGHVHSSCGVSLDPSRQYVVLADGRSLQVWNLKTRQRVSLQPLKGAECVEFSHDAKQLLASVYPSLNDSGKITLDSDVTVKRFSFSHGSLEFVSDLAASAPLDDKVDRIHSIITFSFVPNSDEHRRNPMSSSRNEKVAILTRGSLELYTIDGSHRRIPLAGLATAGWFSPSGRSVIVSYEDGRARVFKLDTASLLAAPPATRLMFVGGAAKVNNQVTRLQYVSFSDDSRRMVTGSSDGYVIIQDNPWEAKAISSPHLVVGQLAGSISAVAISETDTGRELIAAGTNAGSASIAAVFRTRLSKQSGPANNYQTRDPRLRFVATGYDSQTFTFQGALTWLDLAEHGKTLVAASADQKARIFEVGSGVEIERIPHAALVVYAVQTEEGLLSVSQDAGLALTNISKSLAQREWQPNECPTAASALSISNDWAWACQGTIHFFNNDPKLQADDQLNAAVVRSSMYFSDDGSGLIWVTQRAAGAQGYIHSVHYARRSGTEWKAARPAVLPPSMDNPVIARGTAQDLVAVAFSEGSDKSQWDIEVLRTGAQQVAVEKLVSARNGRILSLAIAPDGSIAAGTVNNSVLYFKRRGADWLRMPERFLVEIPEQQTKGVTGTRAVGRMPYPSDGAAGQALSQGSNSVNHIVTAVAFMSDSQLLAARADQTIWFFEDLGAATTVHVSGLSAQGSDWFVFDTEKKHVAAVGSNFATVLAIDGSTLRKQIALQEPGIIQSIVFKNGNRTVTSVATTDSLTRVNHDLQLAHHEARICSEQPAGSDDTVDDCNRLKPE